MSKKVLWTVIVITVMRVISFDIGGTKIAKAVVEIEENGKYDFLDYSQENNPVESLKVKKIFLDYSSKARDSFGVKKVAISSARIANSVEKKIYDAQNYYGTEIFDFNFFEKEGFELLVGNDGHCFSLGEYSFGCGTESESMLSLAIGTGIGGGFVYKGRLFSGFNGSAMEVSHMAVELDGRQCSCGRKGCWSSYASGGGIEESYRISTGREKTSEGIFSSAEEDPAAKEALKVAGDYFSLGLANLLNVFDPQLVVFGGSVSKQGEYITKGIEKAKQQVLNKQVKYHFEISKLAGKANLLGAASLWF